MTLVVLATVSAAPTVGYVCSGAPNCQHSIRAMPAGSETTALAVKYGVHLAAAATKQGRKDKTIRASMVAFGFKMLPPLTREEERGWSVM